MKREPSLTVLLPAPRRTFKLSPGSFGQGLIMMAHKLATNTAVLDCETSEIRLLLEHYAGVLIDKPSEAMADCLARHIEASHLTSAAELIGTLKASPEECDTLLERLLPADTAFFRCPGAFDALEKKILPEIRARKAGESPASLRIWSAGCSTGEEAYSIAMSVCEVLSGDSGGWKIHIVAGDIRCDALRTGERGLYEQRSLEHVPHSLISSYFSRVGDHFLVKPRLRNLITFAPMNLAQPTFIGRFDCIFCMDVLPHFSMHQRSALLHNLYMYLEPGGHLLLGQNEKLPATEVSFTPKAHLACTYYQRPMAAAAKSGR